MVTGAPRALSRKFSKPGFCKLCFKTGCLIQKRQAISTTSVSTESVERLAGGVAVRTDQDGDTHPEMDTSQGDMPIFPKPSRRKKKKITLNRYLKEPLTLIQPLRHG